MFKCFTKINKPLLLLLNVLYARGTKLGFTFRSGIKCSVDSGKII